MRTPRLILPGVPHHVILRGNNRRVLFSYPSDYKTFLRFLLYGLRAHPCLIHALCLMSNHVHLLLLPAIAEAVPKLVHLVAMRYAQYRNQQHGDTGKLFESRFKSFPVLNEAQLARVTAYIELNPVRAGMRVDPAAHPYSTYALHLGRDDRTDVPRRLWTPSDWYVGLGGSAEARAAHYADWVAEVRSRDFAPDHVSLAQILEAAHTDRWLRRPDGTRAS